MTDKIQIFLQPCNITPALASLLTKLEDEGKFQFILSEDDTVGDAILKLDELSQELSELVVEFGLDGHSKVDNTKKVKHEKEWWSKGRW